MNRSAAVRSAAPLVALVVGLATAIALAAGCGDDDNVVSNGGPGPGATDTIRIGAGTANAGANAFFPPIDTVQVGQTVKMLNNDVMAHNINSVNVGGPNWGTLSPGSGNNVTVNTPGTFNYRCTIAGHNMTGIIVVLP